MAEASMQGKICLVTGSSSGIGLVTARELARQGATVVMLCRNTARGEAAQAEIKAATGQQVDLIVADLAVLSDVRHAADVFKQRYEQIHVLINNAGGINATRKLTPDGLEATFVTNYLAPFLLTMQLVDLLKASSPARVINVSSLAHQNASINFDDLQGEKRFSSWQAYSQAKLALIFFTYELADRLKETGVTVNALHPGVIASRFSEGLSTPLRLGWRLFTPFLSNVEKGARTTIYLATSPDVAGVTGKYFSASKEKASSPLSYDETIRRHLWEVGEELISTPATL